MPKIYASAYQRIAKGPMVTSTGSRSGNGMIEIGMNELPGVHDLKHASIRWQHGRTQPSTCHGPCAQAARSPLYEPFRCCAVISVDSGGHFRNEAARNDLGCGERKHGDARWCRRRGDFMMNSPG